jgi:predicted tellurium resistance membrane protein TerC
VLVLALAVIGITLLTFIVTTLADEPASIVTLLAILVLSIGLDIGWSRKRDRMEIREG